MTIGEGANGAEKGLPLLSDKPSLWPDTHRVSPFRCPGCHQGMFVDVQINPGSVVAVRALPWPLPRQRYSSDAGHPLQHMPQTVLSDARSILDAAQIGLDPVETNTLADVVVTAAANYVNRQRRAILQLADLIEQNGLDLDGMDFELIAQIRTETVDGVMNTRSPALVAHDVASEALFHRELEYGSVVPPDVWQHVEGSQVDAQLRDVIYIVYGNIDEADRQGHRAVTLVEVTEDRRQSAFMAQFDDDQRQEWKRIAGKTALALGFGQEVEAWRAVTS